MERKERDLDWQDELTKRGSAMMVHGMIEATKWIWEQLKETFSMEKVLERRVHNCPFLNEPARRYHRI